MNENIKILVIDDEEDVLRGCGRILEALGNNPLLFSDHNAAINIFKDENIDLVFCDLLMPDVDGLKMIELFQKLNPYVPVIIFTAYGTIDRAVAAMKAGAFDFIEKPFDSAQIDIVIQKAFRHRNLYLERDNLLKQLEEKFKFDNIIGKSIQMKKVFEMTESVSKTNANIFITGESGTGKELIARSIHAHSIRKTKAFVPINCSAFPESLFDSEIFGYEKGAFTGAEQRKIGLLEYADGGTFFMDEVCELPLTLQSKLLRAIQEKKLRRVGGNDLIDIDVRFISATNENIENALQSQKLREDLYYRLNVINIHLPPLRERKEDIRLLAEHFLQKASQRLNKNVYRFTDDVIDIFENCKWQGNIRELENVIERAVTITKSESITPYDLPQYMTQQSSGSLSFDNLKLADAKQKTIESVEKKYLLHLLKKYNGQVTKMSEEAGMTRRNIHRLLKQYNFNPADYRK